MPTSVARVVRSVDRYVTLGPGLDSRHSFAFGEHYDADNTRFGALLAVNEETVAAGAGYAMHPHAGLDIVTWVLSGRVEHGGSTGVACVTGPGDVHVLRSGWGMSHSQFSADGAECHYVQLWIAGNSDEAPTQAVVSVAGWHGLTGIKPVVTLEFSGARLYAARLPAGARAAVPAAALLHVFVAAGGADVEGVGELAAGDSARRWDAPAGRVTALDEGCELLLWELRG